MRRLQPWPLDLRDRAQALNDMLSPCRLCPRECGADRLTGQRGLCHAGAGAVVAGTTAHFGEEPEISGTGYVTDPARMDNPDDGSRAGGSGTIFFAGCNLQCVYCQNHEISQGFATRQRESTPEELADIMLDLQARACQNINWVTPSHVVPQAVAGLAIAVERGLEIPLVYNTSGFDGLEALSLLDEVVDVYLADLRYADAGDANIGSHTPGYPEAARAAILEMARQVGTDNINDENGHILRGLIIRLLVLPNDLAGARESLAFIRDSLGTGVRISLMSQYFPTFKANDEPLLSRRTSITEYLRVVETAERMGFENALIQEPESADFYRPSFEGAPDEPFKDAKHFR